MNTAANFKILDELNAALVAIARSHPDVMRLEQRDLEHAQQQQADDDESN